MNLIKNKTILKLSICVFIFLGAINMKAEFSDWTRPFVGPGQKISTLIITGNYARPRIIAELIQASTRQPILLIPAEGQDGIYFLPPEKDGGKAMKIPFNKMTNFINFLGAKQIIILGDSKYVADKYADKISDIQTVCKISSKNWQKTADALGKFLNLPNLPGDYKSLEAKMADEVSYVRSEQNEDDADNSQDISSTGEIKPLPIIDSAAANGKDTVIQPIISTDEPFVIDPSQK